MIKLGIFIIASWMMLLKSMARCQQRLVVAVRWSVIL
jgi:hypothetical protein